MNHQAREIVLDISLDSEITQTLAGRLVAAPAAPRAACWTVARSGELRRSKYTECRAPLAEEGTAAAASVAEQLRLGLFYGAHGTISEHSILSILYV